MLAELPRNSVDIYEQIREMTADFARQQIRPQAEKLDRNEEFPVELFRQMAELGLFGVTIPGDYGGGGVDCYGYAIVMEELSRGYSSVADQCGLVELVSSLIFRYGTDAQKDRYLRPITGFQTKVAYCLTEAEAGSDLSAIKTTAGIAANRPAAVLTRASAIPGATVTIDIDGTTAEITYTGLEPVIMDSGIANLTINLTGGFDDVAILGDNGAVPALRRIARSDSQPGL